MYLEYMKIAVDLINGIAWPVAAIIIAYALRSVLRKLFARTKGFTLKLLGVDVVLTADQAEDVLQDIFADIIEEAKILTTEKRQLVMAIKEARGKKKLEEIFKQLYKRSFVRGMPEHERLRDLRNSQIIRPSEGGRWQPDKHPIVHPMTQALLKRYPNIFDGPMPATPPSATTPA